MNFPSEHLATVLKYGGISFIAGAVNHGFFSESRSLATAAIGVAFYILGAVLDAYREGKGADAWRSAFGLAIVFSIGIGFFTGGLQHFPDSPERSAWVVPLGFALSLVSLFWLDGRWKAQHRNVALYAALSLAVVTAGSFVGYRYLESEDGHAHSHDHGQGHSHASAAPATANPAPSQTARAPATAPEPIAVAPAALPPAPAPSEAASPAPVAVTAAPAPVVDAPASSMAPPPAPPQPREIAVVLTDEKRFVPSQISVKQGETVAFKLTNTGRMKHEFALGSEKELRQHAAEKKKAAAGGHSHRHDGPSHAGQSVALAAGETKTLVLTFDRLEDLNLGCFEPGHAEAGMRGKVQVARRE